jgi:aminopeptidase N
MKREFALPGTQAQYAPDRRFDIQHYRLAVELDVEARRLTGTCSITLTPLTDSQRWVILDAVELEVQSVHWASNALAYSHDGKVLRIDLGREVATGETVEIDVNYRAEPRRGLYFVGPDDSYPDKPTQVWSQGQDRDSRYWFPCFDSPHEKATSEVIATVPRGWFALSNGTLVERIEDDGQARARFHWQFDTPHSCYLITLVAGELSELEDRWDDVDVRYYCARGREDDCRRTLRRTPEMLELFSKSFGVRYPYKKYAQVFVADFIFGGMENTTATTLTDLVMLDERAELDCDMEALVAHELAHQWFGDLLTCRDWGQGWLNEGFATYAEYLWREHAEGRDAAALELDEWATQYYKEDSGRYRRPIATNLYEDPIDVFDHHLYEKGGRVLHMLRQILGDELFWKSIAHYLRKHRTGSVETRDLARAVEEATGRVLDWFFDQWILKNAGHPELDIDYAWEAERKLARFTVKQTQKLERDTPLFRLPTRLRFCTADGTDLDYDIELTEAQQSFYVPLTGEPTQAIFDPGKHLLAQTTVHKGTPLWTAQLRDASEAIDRIYAARALAKIGGKAVEQALVTALKTDRFWAVKSEAAEALAALRTPTARDALIAAIAATEHPKARRGIVKALGAFRYDERAADALIGVIDRGDRSCFVEAEACQALGRTRTKRAPAVLRSVLDRDSFNDVIRQHAYRGLAAARDDSAIALLIDASRYGHGNSSTGRRAAIAALAELARGRRDRDAQVISEHLRDYLRDRDFRVQGAAIEGLAVIADPASLDPLNDTAANALDARLRRRAREVSRDISEGRARDAQLEELRTELDKLRTELVNVRAQVATLTEPQRSEAGRHDRLPAKPRPAPAAVKTAERGTAAARRSPRATSRPARSGAPKPRTPNGKRAVAQKTASRPVAASVAARKATGKKAARKRTR